MGIRIKCLKNQDCIKTEKVVVFILTVFLRLLSSFEAIFRRETVMSDNRECFEAYLFFCQFKAD